MAYTVILHFFLQIWLLNRLMFHVEKPTYLNKCLTIISPLKVYLFSLFGWDNNTCKMQLRFHLSVWQAFAVCRLCGKRSLFEVFLNFLGREWFLGRLRDWSLADLWSKTVLYSSLFLSLFFNVNYSLYLTLFFLFSFFLLI